MPRPPLRLPLPGGTGHRPTHPRAIVLLAVAACLQLVAGVGAVVLLDRPAPAPALADGDRARAAPPLDDADPQSLASRTAREQEVRALLARRSAALLRRDRVAFLADVDPAAPELLARQTALLAATEQVPLSTWRWVLDPGTEAPSDPRLDERYGRDGWWAPAVVLEHALTGYDTRPVRDVQHPVFVQRDGRWLLGADHDDIAAAGAPTPQALWDQGPVVAERRGDVLVLGRPQQRELLRDLAGLAAQAVPRVSAVWGQSWRRGVVVLVPGDADELRALLEAEGDLGQIAAVATAELDGGDGTFDPSGDRVVVNPDAFGRLGSTGRQVVVTHELTHVATRRATGPAVPAWLAEGFADHVAYGALDLPLSVAARELRTDVQAGRLPTVLPLDSDFDGGNAALAQAYEQAWLAVRLLADVHGQAALLRFYRAVGAARGVEPAAAVEQALRDELGTTTGQLTADWRASLQRSLG